MQVISAIVGGKQAFWLTRITRHGVEVDDRIEGASRANPFIDGPTIGFAQWTGVIIVRADIWGDGGTDHANTVRVCPGDDLLIGRNYPPDAFLVFRPGHFS